LSRTKSPSLPPSRHASACSGGRGLTRRPRRQARRYPLARWAGVASLPRGERDPQPSEARGPCSARREQAPRPLRWSTRQLLERSCGKAELAGGSTASTVGLPCFGGGRDGRIGGAPPADTVANAPSLLALRPASAPQDVACSDPKSAAARRAWVPRARAAGSAPTPVARLHAASEQGSLSVPHQEQKKRIRVQGVCHQIAHGCRVLAGLRPVRARAARLHSPRPEADRSWQRPDRRLPRRQSPIEQGR